MPQNGNGEIGKDDIIIMKMIKDKQILVAADKAGFPLKEAVVNI